MSSVQLEEISRQIELVLRGALPGVLDAIELEMQVQDDAYFGAIGEPVPATPLDPPVRYFLGHTPTILERPIEEFPVVMVMCHRQQGLGGGDSYDRINHQSYVEAYVIADDESTANRMSWRYAKAIHRVLKENPTLTHLVEIADEEPVVDVSNVFQRRASSVDNTIWHFQGCRIDFAVNQNQPVTNTMHW